MKIDVSVCGRFRVEVPEIREFPEDSTRDQLDDMDVAVWLAAARALPGFEISEVKDDWEPVDDVESETELLALPNQFPANLTPREAWFAAQVPERGFTREEWGRHFGADAEEFRARLYSLIRKGALFVTPINRAEDRQSEVDKIKKHIAEYQARRAGVKK